jgi:hypothetical protein
VVLVAGVAERTSSGQSGRGSGWGRRRSGQGRTSSSEADVWPWIGSDCVWPWIGDDRVWPWIGADELVEAGVGAWRTASGAQRTASERGGRRRELAAVLGGESRVRERELFWTK